MTDLALDIQNNAPRNLLKPPTVSMPSSFSAALDSVRKYTVSRMSPDKNLLMC